MECVRKFAVSKIGSSDSSFFIFCRSFLTNTLAFPKQRRSLPNSLRQRTRVKPGSEERRLVHSGMSCMQRILRNKLGKLLTKVRCSDRPGVVCSGSGGVIFSLPSTRLVCVSFFWGVSEVSSVSVCFGERAANRNEQSAVELCGHFEWQEVQQK